MAFYRLVEVEESGSESPRVTEARARAAQRLSRQRGTLRPLGHAAIVVVAVTTIAAHPAPALNGKGAGVLFALVVFAATFGSAIRDRFATLELGAQAAVIAVMGAAGVALAALQIRGATGLAAGAAAWMAVARLPLGLGVAVAAAVAAGLDVAASLAGSSAAAVLAGTLLCALLALMAHFMRRAREGQDRTEVLLAELQDARDEQTRAAAVAERGRIAGELHDVLAHSLSGAAIQLQGARLLAEREQAGADVRMAIDRASELVGDGLADARQAVAALRGDVPSLAELDSLVDSVRKDLDVDVTLTIEGSPSPLPVEAGLALYRGAQEALTNVARYAPRSSVSVVLRYDRQRTTLTIEDRAPTAPAPALAGAGLPGVGGGRGLAGMRERVERAGGTVRAGPTAEGWRVELDVPA